MQAAETVYEFGSSPDEDDDNNTTGQSSSNKNRTSSKEKRSQIHQQQQPTSIAGTNLRPNKTSSTSINQKLNTSFSSDNHPSSQHSPNPSSTASHHHHHHPNKTSKISESQKLTGESDDVSQSDEQLLLNQAKLTASGGGLGSGGGGAGSSVNIAGIGSISNTSNTSLSSTTTSSRGNISQSGNQSISTSSQRGTGASSSQQQNPYFDSNVISERVKNLATQIYQELKRIISRCNYDEDILSGLMPLIVRVLESLDLALIENQQLQVELELCKDDNDQLIIMFEKEKAAKRQIDQKLINSEYAYEEERQQYQQKIESLDNMVKMCELKAKNASDQAARFEEKEAERKKEYSKLHDRYTELLKSHCDVVERVKHLVGNQEAANIASINVPHQIVASSSESNVGEPQQQYLGRMKLKPEDMDIDRSSGSMKARETLKSWNADTELTLEDASLVVIDDLIDSHKAGDGSSQNESERATSEAEGEHEKDGENDSIAYTSMEKEFRKLIQENKDLLNTKNALNVVKDDLIAEVDRLSNEITMYEQSVEKLNLAKDQMKQKVSLLDTELRKTKEELEKAKQKIRENNEEGVPYSQRKRFGRAEMAKVLMERNNYKEKFMELQEAIRYTELIRANKNETEKRSGLWKFFSNLFGPPVREPLAIGPATGQSTLGIARGPSPMVAFHGSDNPAIISQDQQANSSGLLVGGSDSLQAGSSLGTLRGSSGLVATAASGSGARSIRSTNQRLSNNSDLIVLMDSDLNVDRSRALKDGSGGRLNADAPGYIHAYGWSLPASSVKALASSSGQLDSALARLNPSILGGTSSHVSDNLYQSGSFQADNSVSFSGKLPGLHVPIPQYCRPLTGDSLGMKIWCATAIDLSGGYHNPEKHSANQRHNRQPNFNNGSRVGGNDSSGSIVNISTSTPIKSHDRNALKMLEQDIDQALKESRQADSLDMLEATDISQATSSTRPILKATTEMVLSALPISDDVEELSSCVWICSTQHSRSKITIIDIKTKPNELLDSFYVPTFLYCIKSIPGCKASDTLGIESSNSKASSSGSDEEQQRAQKISITMSVLKELIQTQKGPFYRLVEVDPEAESKLRKARMEARSSKGNKSTTSGHQQDEAKPAVESSSFDHPEVSQSTIENSNKTVEDDAEISRILDNNSSVGIATLQKLNDFVAHTQPPQDEEGQQEPNFSGKLKASKEAEEAQIEDDSQQNVTYYQPISTSLSTVWMGGRDTILYIHSAIGQWKDCVACVKLPDSIVQICHFKGKVFVALADGTLCVFFRNISTKEWEFSHYLQIDINLMSEATSELTSDHLTSGSPFNAPTGNRDKTIPTTSDDQDHPTADTSSLQQQPNESPQMTPQHGTHKPTTRSTKVAGIRCLEIANKNLWIGYRNMVLIMDPITMKLKHTFNVVPQKDNQIRQLVSMKDGVFCCLRSDLILRLYSSIKPYQHIQNIDIEPVVTRLISPKTFVISHITAMKVADNTLWIGNAHGIILTIPCQLIPQISEAPIATPSGEFEECPSSLTIARFVPKCDIANAQISFHGHKDAVKFFILAHNLMLSGGQGYLDFRLDMDDQSKSISDKSHLILWQLPQ